MTAVRSGGVGTRTATAMLLALLLALRLLSPAGFMPAFDDGAVTIVACPDGAPTASRAGHDHHRAKLHQACPYAAASALGGLTNAPPPLAAPPIVGEALLPGSAFTFLDPPGAFQRPPQRGPPIPA